MTQIVEAFDHFGLPVMKEERYRPNSAEEARDRLEKARDEARRAMDELRDIQPEHDANDRVGAELKSALVSIIDVEKHLITSIHKVENLIHRIRKLQPTESKTLREDMEIEVPFVDPTYGRVVALFDVSGQVGMGDNERLEWIGSPKVELLSVTAADDPNQLVDVHPKPSDLEKLEDEALQKYLEAYKDVD